MKMTHFVQNLERVRTYMLSRGTSCVWCVESQTGEKGESEETKGSVEAGGRCRRGAVISLLIPNSSLRDPKEEYT
jgi:hypothetical protein